MSFVMVPFSLEVGGTISGHVYQQDGVTPIPNVWVDAEDYDTGEGMEGTHTEQDGSYSMVLPTGAYRVAASPSYNGLDYFDEWYDNTRYREQATAVSVTIPNDTPNIDFSLEVGGTISGHVYQQDGVTPIPNVNVSANDYDTGEYMEGTSTEQDGSYSLVLPTGAYRVSAGPSHNGLKYAREYYDDTHDWEQATAISVTAPNDTPNIDFSLEA